MIRYNTSIEVATFADIANLSDDVKKLGTEVFVTDEQTTYVYDSVDTDFKKISVPFIASGSLTYKIQG